MLANFTEIHHHPEFGDRSGATLEGRSALFRAHPGSRKPFVARFLQSGASRNLLSINVTCVREYAATGQLEVTVDSVCEAFGAALRHCTRLQYVKLGFVHRDDGGGADLLSKPDGLLPILANLPRRTLRVFAVNIWLRTLRPWCCTSTLGAFDGVDRAFAPGAPSGGGREGRFSDLRRVELWVYQEEPPPRLTCMKPLEKHNPRALPRLDAAGLLAYGVGRIDNDLPVAEVFWPSEE